MPTTSEALGAAAAPMSIEYGGKTYQGRAITQKVKSQVERWLEKRAMASVMRFRADLDMSEFRALSAAVTADIAAGKYAFGGPYCTEALGTMAGGVAFASFIFSCTEEEMEALFLARPEEVTQALELIQQQSFPQKKTEAAEDMRPPTPSPTESDEPTQGT